MFPKHARYKTQGIGDNLNESIQMFIWTLIDRDLENTEKLDYLQVFELFAGQVDGKPVQHIRQRQEQPTKNRLHTIFSIHEPVVELKVWVIDSGGVYCTMLLPSEY